jgi:periplasmic copper chaperone A
MLNEDMSIDISRPWARTSPTLAGFAGGYFTITNKAAEADRLLGAESPAAAKIEIHAIKVVGPGITMKPMEKGLGLPPGTAITLKPRGYHLWIELKAPLAQGQKVPVTLKFEKAGTRSIELTVEAPGAIGNDAMSEGQPG